MAPTQKPSTITPTANIDCTILIALVSDICHYPRSLLPAPPSGPGGLYDSPAVNSQIAAESSNPVLPNELYPILTGRALVCVPEAEAHVQQIVDTMATPSERARMSIIFAKDAYSDRPRSALVSALADLSTHAVPADLELPITLTAFPPPNPNFPGTVARRVCARIFPDLDPLNKPIVLFGWAAGFTTVTSNGVLMHRLERAINRVLEEEEKEGRGDAVVDGFTAPSVYLCRAPRSLVGKQRQHRRGQESGKGGRSEADG